MGRVVRIVLTTAVYAICSLFAIAFYSAAAYLEPIPGLYEAFALVAIFLLLVELAQPEIKRPEPATVELVDACNIAKSAGKLSRRWFLTIWIMVFQILPGRILTTIAAEVVEARRCHTDPSYRIAHVVIAVVQALQTIICLLAILLFHHRFRSKLRPHGGGVKLILFKLVILTQLVQRVIFAILEYKKELHPSVHISYFDLTLGIPPALTCIESFFFSVVFLGPFSVRRLQRSSRAPQTTKTPLKAAIVDTFRFSYLFHRTWRLRTDGDYEQQCGHAVTVEGNSSVEEEETQGGVPQVVVIPKGSTT